MGNQHPSIAPYETLRTGDGLLAVAIGTDPQFVALAHAVGRAGLAGDARFATNRDRVVHRPALVRELEDALSVGGAGAWTTALQAAGIPCGPVNDIEQAVELAQTLGLEPVVSFAQDDRTIATVASPLTLHRTPVQYHRGPPALGQDNAEVLAWLDDPEAPQLSED
jgi:formyl-CoA transferase